MRWQSSILHEGSGDSALFYSLHARVEFELCDPSLLWHGRPLPLRLFEELLPSRQVKRELTYQWWSDSSPRHGLHRPGHPRSLRETTLQTDACSALYIADWTEGCTSLWQGNPGFLSRSGYEPSDQTPVRWAQAIHMVRHVVPVSKQQHY